MQSIDKKTSKEKLIMINRGFNWVTFFKLLSDHKVSESMYLEENTN